MALRCISSMATRRILAELAKRFQERSGRSVELVSVGGVEAARRLREGERFDLAALAADAIAALSAGGLVEAGGVTPFARSRMAVAIPAGAARPHFDDEDALKRVVLAAAKVAYSTGPSGAQFLALLKHWEVEAEMSPRLLQAPPGVPVAALLARGEAALGFQQLSELLNEPGVEVIDLPPTAVQATTLFAIGICPNASDDDGAREFASFLASGAAEDVLRRHGMEPP
jgi:molybdate transport system substrate-binding protein